MPNWFKSKFERVAGYSPNWYGTLDYAPNATVVLYDDNELYCIGFMEESLPDVDSITPLTAQEAQDIIENLSDEENVWFGEKLENRWNEKEEEADESGG
jgi:hypothetical protein